MSTIVKNYSRSPLFFLIWILIGSTFGAIAHSKEEMAFRLLVFILVLIVLNGSFAFAIGYLENNDD